MSRSGTTSALPTTQPHDIIFAASKEWRCVATRYDRYPTAFFSTFALAATVIV